MPDINIDAAKHLHSIRLSDNLRKALVRIMIYNRFKHANKIMGEHTMSIWWSMCTHFLKDHIEAIESLPHDMIRYESSPTINSLFPYITYINEIGNISKKKMIFPIAIPVPQQDGNFFTNDQQIINDVTDFIKNLTGLHGKQIAYQQELENFFLNHNTTKQAFADINDKGTYDLLVHAVQKVIEDPDAYSGYFTRNQIFKDNCDEEEFRFVLMVPPTAVQSTSSTFTSTITSPSWISYADTTG